MKDEQLKRILDSAGKSNFAKYYTVFRDNHLDEVLSILSTGDLMTNESRTASYNAAKRIFEQGLEKRALQMITEANPNKVKGGLDIVIGAYQLLIDEHKDNHCARDFLDSLKKHFEMQVNASISQSVTIGYTPTAFIQMISSYGGILNACKKLVSSSDINAGLTRLYEEGRLDLSVEAQIIKPLYEKLFSPSELEVAKATLKAHGYQFAPDDVKELNSMQIIQVTKQGNHYLADIDISIDEWKTLLSDNDTFSESSLDMIEKWYKEPECQSSSKYIMAKYKIDKKGTPFNGVVKGLSNRITKKLNRSQVLGTTGEPSYWAIPFEGWEAGDLFIWKLRDNLIQAISELNLFDDIVSVQEVDLTTTIISDSALEGRKVAYYTTRYERSRVNREKAIALNGGYRCSCCGFDFEATYGELGKGFIEVHHNKPLYSLKKPMYVNPETDLDCVCSNCHKMLHRSREAIITVSQLKELLRDKDK